MVRAGFGKEMILASTGFCPFCRKVVRKQDFKDDLSKREHKISGLCQKCQDDVFGSLNRGVNYDTEKG